VVGEVEDYHVFPSGNLSRASITFVRLEYQREGKTSTLYGRVAASKRAERASFSTQTSVCSGWSSQSLRV
jgi:hypothetical protein